MKLNVILLSIGLILIAGCSAESDQVPEEEHLGAVDVLDISYVTDDGRKATATITPESGGTVQAVNADGVVFDLTVGPGAIDSSLAVTITPFSLLSIKENEPPASAASNGVLSVGVSGAPRPNSAQQQEAACVCGAYFEPDGLTFDSTAVLTVTFPQQGFDCDWDEISIVSVDSSESLYEILPTTFDAGANALACTLAHFSGWGTHGPDEDLLRRLINSAITYGNAAPSDEFVRLLASYRQWAVLKGWNDLADLAWNGAWAVFGKLTEAAIAGRDIDEMVRRLQEAQAWGFDDYVAQLGEAIDTEVRSMAARGRSLCGGRRYDEGRALMFRALDYAQRGLVEDPGFQTQVKSWLADCGALNVELIADKAIVYDLARSEDDERTFVTFEVRVTDMNGDPVDGVTPNLWWELPSRHQRAAAPAPATPAAVAPVAVAPVRDEPGVTRLRYAYRASPTDNTPEGVATFWGVVSTAGTDNLSAPVTVTLRRARITLDCTFSFAAEWTYTDPDGGGTEIASYDAHGWTTTQGNLNCATLSRSYSQTVTGPAKNESGQCIGYDDPKLPVCNMISLIYVYGQSNDEFETPLTIIDRASVWIGYPLSHMWTECSHTLSGNTREWKDWKDRWEILESTSEINHEFDYLYWDGSSFPAYQFDRTEPLALRRGTWSANLNVTVTVE
jgi:hypothetical protein